MKQKTFVVAGAGQAAATAVAELRRNGFDGRIVMIGDEPHVPYERPPLSKDMLLAPETARVSIFSDSWYDEQRIELRTGTRVDHLDAEAHRLGLGDGTTLGYDRLLIATGSRARRLPLLDKLGDGVHVLRTLDDARRLKPAIGAGRCTLLVGGGVIGLELASSITELGGRAIVVEQAGSVMERCAPAPLRAFLLDLHRGRGVAFHLGVRLVDARREANRIVLELEDGTVLQGDSVVYGIGAEPCSEFAERAGLATGNGIVIDECGRTSFRDIYAAGDVACRRDKATGQPVRRETWESANIQAVAAARAMLDLDETEAVVPWFWTDQGGRNIQFAGDMQAPEWILRGAVTDAAFIWFGLRDGVMVGAVAVNKGREMRSLKTLIAGASRVDAARLRDPAVDLRKLAAG